MSLPIPFTVRLQTARADRHIERDLRSLSLRSVVPGGFASAQFSLDRPLALQPDEIAYFGKVHVYDARNGSVVWSGRLEDPGRGVGADGQVWQIAAIGPSAYAQDRTVPYIVVDSAFDRWKQNHESKRVSQASQEEFDDETPAMVLKFNPGTAANTNDHCVIVYRHIWYANQKIARIRLSWDNGATVADTLWQNRIGTGVDTGGQTIRRSSGWSTTPVVVQASVGDGTFPIPVGQNVATLRITRTGANLTTSAAGDAWGRFTGIFIRTIQMNADGTEITTPYTISTVRAHWVVNDLLGRLLTEYDGADAEVSTASTYEIVQMAYPDGITPGGVLDDLMLFEPTFYWAAWEPNSAGKHHFEWREWPTHVRYEADVVDGFDSPGSAAELYNRVTVRWLNEWGFARPRILTQAVPALDDAGLIREAFIDISNEVGSGADATKVGEQFLAEHASPPNAGTLTVARPIYDHDRGASVMPWEIRPGHLIRVRGVRPSVNSLNATARDGVTVFRVVSVDYDTASASARLELDSFAPTVARALAQAGKQWTGQQQRRRR